MNEITTVEEKRHAVEDAFWEAAAKWPSDFFSREDLVVFSGNAFSVGHLANLDSKGDGPEGSFYNGRKRLYKKVPAVKWILGRIKVTQ